MRGPKHSSGMLYPTLWRSCRVLANKTRLRILKHVIIEPGQRVSEIASKFDMSLPLASRHLRALSARGLINACPSGATVSYVAKADRAVPSAGVLLAAVKRTLVVHERAIDEMYRELTAFTHQRRVTIVRHLSRDELTEAELRRRTRMSQAAIERHLKKLRERGFVERGRCGYRMCRRSDTLGRVLVELACQ